MMYRIKKLRYWIPLYLNGSLSERERQEFEDALDQYPRLKEELEEFSEIKEFYYKDKEIKKDVSLPSDFLYQRIQRNIEYEKRPSPSFFEEGSIAKVLEFLKGLFSSPRLSWGIAAVQFAIILLLIINLTTGNGFETLTSRHSQQGDGMRINVVFDKESKEKEIREALNRIGATIVKGPSPEGLYTIMVKNDQDLEMKLEVLRKAEIIRFVEKAY